MKRLRKLAGFYYRVKSVEGVSFKGSIAEITPRLLFCTIYF